MENILAKQSDVKMTSDFQFSNAIVSEVELTDGKRTQVVVIFNQRELHFEDINIGLNMSLSRCKNVSKSKNTFCSIRNGILKPFALFQKKVWNRKT